MSVLDGVIFDKDGTLFDFQKSWGVWAHGFLTREAAGNAARMAELAAVLAYDPVTRGFAPDSIVIAHTAEEIATALLPLYPGETAMALCERIDTEAARTLQAEVTPLLPLLTRLRAMHLKLGVMTNDSERPARAHLEAAGIDDLFDFIAGADSGFGAKPSPKPLLRFCEVTRVAPESCAMIGDSLHDLRAGRAAGMRTVGVLTGLARKHDLQDHADVVLPSIADLPDWIGAL